MEGPEVKRPLAGANWNLKIGRDPDQVVAEVAGLIKAHHLDFVAVCEASTYVGALKKASRRRGPLGKAGLKVLAYPHGSIPARETAIVVRRRSKGGPGGRDKRLHDITNIGWERDPKNRSMGFHPGRESVSARVGWLRLLAVHTPPGPFGKEYPRRRRSNLAAFAAHAEIAKRWARGLHLATPRALQVGDWNRHPSDPVVDDTLGLTPWKITGDGIDWAAGLNVEVTDVVRVHYGHSDHWPVLFTVSPT
jgi:hypothetical protein